MGFCTNCGKPLVNHAKFCPFCGTSVEASQNDHQNKCRQEYMGKIKKCPVCGEEIPSFTAICPACGHEINTTKVASSLTDFINQLDECERSISNSPKLLKNGWSTWSKKKRVGWVIFNIFFACIPLVLYLLMPLLRYNSTPSLTPEEKKKADLIENYAFPNDRESILEGLLFTKSKVEFIASERVDRQSAFWGRLWGNKAKQLYKKAEILISGDQVALDAYADIQQSRKKIKKFLRIRALAGIAVLAVFLVLVGIRGGAIDTTAYNTTLEWPATGLASYLPEPDTNYGKTENETEKQVLIKMYKITQSQFDDYTLSCREKGFNVDITKNDSMFYANDANGLALNIFYDNHSKIMKIFIDSYNIVVKGFEEGTYETLKIKKYFFNIPTYWNEKGSKKEYRQFYAETGDKVAMLSIGYPVDEHDPVNLDALYADNDNMITSIESIYKDCEVIDFEDFESDGGVKGIIYRFSFKLKVGWSKYDASGLYFCFPSPEDNRWYYVILATTDNIEADYYVTDYLKTIASIKTN